MERLSSVAGRCAGDSGNVAFLAKPLRFSERLAILRSVTVFWPPTAEGRGSRGIIAFPSPRVSRSRNGE